MSEDECRYCNAKLKEPKPWLKAFCNIYCEQNSKDNYDRYVDPLGKRFMRDEYD